MPPLTSGPGPLDGATVKVGDLARAGLVDITEGQVLSTSDQLDTSYLEGFVRSGANIRRSTSASGSFRADARGSRIPRWPSRTSDCTGKPSGRSRSSNAGSRNSPSWAIECLAGTRRSHQRRSAPLAGGLTCRNGLGVPLHDTYSASLARVHATKSTQRSLSRSLSCWIRSTSSGVISFANGTALAVTPTAATHRNSSPFMACMVARCTPSASAAALTHLLKKCCELHHPGGQVTIYLDRSRALRNVIEVVIHPETRAVLLEALEAIRGLAVKSGLRHHSNLRQFPKRRNNGVAEITFGSPGRMLGYQRL